jgi:hypothetical protein
MNNTTSGWLKMPFGETDSLFRLIKAQSLAVAEAIAEDALRLIVDGGYQESSIVSYNSESCTISLHAAVENKISQDYYDLANKIDKAVEHVRP